MERSTQQVFRFMIPGIATAFWCLPFIKGKFEVAEVLDGLKWSEGGLVFIVVTVWAVVYYLSGAQKYFSRQSFRPVNAFICDTLVGASSLNPDERSRARSNAALMQVFWKLVDSSESLKSKATEAYFNGILVTALADVAVISAIGGLVHLVVWLVRPVAPAGSVWWLVMAPVLCVLGVIGVRLTVARHKRIASDQLAFITTHHLHDLEDALIKLIT